MLRTFGTRKTWEAAAIELGYEIEVNGYEDDGDPENGPHLSYIPDLAWDRTTEELVGMWIEVINVGALGSYEEIDTWAENLCGRCGTGLEPGGCPKCGDF